MLKLFIELVITGTLIAGTPAQDKPGNGETIVPKTVQPTIEKGYRPDVPLLTPTGPPGWVWGRPMQQYNLQMVTPPPKTKPFILKRCKWPCERSA